MAITVAALSAPAGAQGKSCWSNPTDTPATAGFVCVKLTEALLLDQRGAVERDVMQAMGVPVAANDQAIDIPGTLSSGGALHFISNFDEGSALGSGEVSFRFGSDGRVADIDATVSGGPAAPIVVFVWTADGPSCSDFPGSKSRRCDQ